MPTLPSGSASLVWHLQANCIRKINTWAASHLLQPICTAAPCWSILLDQKYALLQVVRCFEDEDVHHVNGKVDPAEDAETINFELALADVGQIEKRLERLKKGRAKTKEEQASNEVTDCLAIVESHHWQ